MKNQLFKLFTCIGIVLIVINGFLSCSNEPATEEKTEDQVPAFSYFDTIYLSQLDNLFGEEGKAAIIDYNIQVDTANFASSVELAYRQGQILRDTLGNILVKKMEALEPHQLPDLFWLNEVMPHFVPQLVAEGTTYYLFNDYKSWSAKAAQTPQQEDDLFMQLSLNMFPDDSIEYFFPVWFLQTWDYGGYSLLGRKHHETILNQINATWADSRFQTFRPEVLAIKDQVVNDITSPHISYWEKKSEIIAELDKIIQSNYDILDENDKMALQKRRKQFENAEKNGIKVNQQAGI